MLHRFVPMEHKLLPAHCLYRKYKIHTWSILLYSPILVTTLAISYRYVARVVTSSQSVYLQHRMSKGPPVYRLLLRMEHTASITVLLLSYLSRSRHVINILSFYLIIISNMD